VRAGVAVIAKNTWAAMKARELLKIKWNEGSRNKDSSEELFKTFAEKAKEKPGEIIFTKGDIGKYVSVDQNSLTATYSAPFLAHATLEPVNFIAQVQGDHCEVWGGLQLPDDALTRISEDCKFKKENIRINLAMMGGGFGRRLRCDFAIEAVKIAQQIDKPVKVIWTREDDIRFDAYRPANYHRLVANWDANGTVEAWQHHLLTTSIATMFKWKASSTEVGGGADKSFWYNIPNVQVGYTHVDINIHRTWLRGVEYCVNVFAVESFIDELAGKLKKDPLQFRLSLLKGMPVLEEGTGSGKRVQDPERIAGVLKLAAEKIGWEQPRKKNHYMGIAGFAYLVTNGYGAHAFEIEMLAPKKFSIKKVIAVVDCGLAVNPDGIRNQLEGGVAFALGQALKNEITIKNSRVVQEGFEGFDLLRFDEMPPVEVYIVPSTANPGGVGEVAIPSVAPALCNALAAAGYRPHNLPIKNEGFTWV
jgi:isoquinoline 1-oxidoreductase beta subunit